MQCFVYTDGACRGNPGPGGWGWAISQELWSQGYEANTTNQRMEITAAFAAAKAFYAGEMGEFDSIEIVSDSTYVVKCFQDLWWKGWIARGWKNAKKQPIANRDLWEPFIELVVNQKNISFR